MIHNPFTMDTDYCQFCEMGVDVSRHFGHRGTEFVYRITCKRCGRVIGYGIYNSVPTLGVSQDVEAFVTAQQEDRT